MKKNLIAVLAAGAMLTNIFAAPVVMAQETGSSDGDLDLGSLFGSLVQEISENPEVSGMINGLAQQLDNVDIDSLTSEDGPLSGLLDGDVDLNSLLSEDGPLAGLLGEDVDLNSLLSEDGPLAGLLDEVKNEDGSVNYEELLGLLGGLFSADLSSGEYKDPSVVVDEYLNILVDRFNRGEVNLTTSNIVAGGTDEQGNFTMLGEFCVFSYNNEDGTLRPTFWAQQPALLTAVPTEDGSYQLEYDEAQDGEDYPDEIARICSKGTDMTADEFYSATDEGTRNLLLFLSFIEYASEHPEVTAIEHNDQVYTVEEAQQYVDDYYAAIWAAVEAATE